MPKPSDPRGWEFNSPNARVISEDDEDCYENRGTFPGTRWRIARACDEGVDVIDVLMDEFTATLCRRGVRRYEIEKLREQAVRELNHEREISGSRDIVDMIMGRANAMGPREFNTSAQPKVTKRMRRLKALKRSLASLMSQEDAATHGSADFVAGSFKNVSMRIERELVPDITIMAEQSGVITRKDSNDWRTLYTKRNHKERERSGPRINLLKHFGRFL